MKQINRIRPSATVLTVALASMALYACNQNGQQAAPPAAAQAAPPPALPLTTGAATAPMYAPSVAALPSAPRPRIVRVASQSDQYAYVDQAQQMGSALGSAPPDYAFDYDGARPWVWRTSDNAARFVEPVDGGYRYYYFQPGQSYPYLVRTPQYAYGFNDGQLVVVYDARGNILPPQYMDQQADYAGRYLARGQSLYNASLQSQRRSVIAANWAARQAQLQAQQDEWNREQNQYAAWQDYHQAHDAQTQAYWQAEHARREASASQFNQWRDTSYQGPPPPPPPYAGIAGAAVVGGVIGGLIAGQHHDNGGPPPPNYGPQGDQGRPVGPGPNSVNSQGAQQAAQQAAIQQARQQQAQQDAQRQAQAQQQAQAAATARAQAIQQGRQQEAAQYGAQQAAAQQQAHQIAAARTQQAAQDAATQHQQQAAAQNQALEAQRAQTQQAHQQQLAQGAVQQQAQAAAKAQAHQQQAAQALAANQAQTAARAQALQAHEQQAAQAAAQRQAEASTRAQAAQAHQQQAAQGAAQHQAQAVQAAHAAAAAKAPLPPHPNGPPPGGHDPKRDGEPHPAQN